MNRSISRVALWCGLLALPAAAGGCQRGPTWNLAPVEGTVTKSGRPLANIQVAFLVDPDASTVGLRSTGITDESGHYRLRTDNADDGAVIGKYRVVLLDLQARRERKGRITRGPQPKKGTQLPPELTIGLEEQWKTVGDRPRLQPRYESFKETPLRVEVPSGPQVIDLEVK